MDNNDINCVESDLQILITAPSRSNSMVENNGVINIEDDINDEEESEYDEYEEEIELPLRKMLTKQLILAMIAAAVGSGFQFGYNSAVLNAPQKEITNWIVNVRKHRNLNISAYETDKDQMAKATIIFSVISGMFCVGGLVGGMLISFIADRFGRKKALLYNNFLVFGAVGFEGFSKTCSSYEMFIIGRFLIGINAGLNCGLSPMYLMEISPINLRGASGTLFQLCITVSIMVATLLGMQNVMGEKSWPILVMLTIIPSLIQMLLLPFCPETPKYILYLTGDEVKAKNALKWFRGNVDTNSEMQLMINENNESKTINRVSLLELFVNKSLRIPLFISLMLMIAQQLCGINAIIFFSTHIFTQAGLTSQIAEIATVLTTLLNVCVTIVSLVLVDRAGRKTLLLIGFVGIFFSTIIMFTSMVLYHKKMVFASYISMSAIFLFIFFFALAPGSIPWFITNELFMQSARPMATAVAVSTNWAANCIVVFSFLPVQYVIDHYVFLIFATLQIIFILFIYKKVPETKNKTTEEIAAMFRQISYQ